MAVIFWRLKQCLARLAREEPDSSALADKVFADRGAARTRDAYDQDRDNCCIIGALSEASEEQVCSGHVI